MDNLVDGAAFNKRKARLRAEIHAKKRSHHKAQQSAQELCDKAYSLGNSRPEEAVRLYRRSIAIDPQHSQAHFALANILDDMGKLQAAIAEYKIVLRLSPQYADAHYNLAHTYVRTVEYRRRAIRHWQKYAKLDPSGKWHDQAVTNIHKLLKDERLALVQQPEPLLEQMELF